MERSGRAEEKTKPTELEVEVAKIIKEKGIKGLDWGAPEKVLGYTEADRSRIRKALGRLENNYGLLKLEPQYYKFPWWNFWKNRCAYIVYLDKVNKFVDARSKPDKVERTG